MENASAIILISTATTSYTGDTATLEPFKAYLDRGSFLYTEAAYYKSEVHLFLKDMLPELVNLAENGIHVYLMHLDAEVEIVKMTNGKPLKLAKLFA